VDSLASESVVAWAEGADAGWEFWMAAARAGSLISRPGWDRRRAVGNALAGGAAVVVGVSEWCWWSWRRRRRRRRRRSITQHAGRELGTVCLRCEEFASMLICKPRHQMDPRVSKCLESTLLPLLLLLLLLLLRNW
jgi:hypothetical protein